MKYIRSIVFVMLIVLWFAVVAFEADKMQADIARMTADIETIKQVSSMNESSIEALRVTNRELSSRGFELEELRQWIITPEKKKFAEACETFTTLGYENSKDLLFRRYIESQVLEEYLVYISADGVCKYKHSYMAKGMVSSNNDWWDKSLYNSVDGENIPITNVIIPEELLTSKRRLNNFLEDMGNVFIMK